MGVLPLYILIFQASVDKMSLTCSEKIKFKHWPLALVSYLDMLEGWGSTAGCLDHSWQMKIPAAWSQSDTDTESQSRRAASSQIESWVSDHSWDLEARSDREPLKHNRQTWYHAVFSTSSPVSGSFHGLRSRWEMSRCEQGSISSALSVREKGSAGTWVMWLLSQMMRDSETVWRCLLWTLVNTPSLSHQNLGRQRHN